VADIRSVRVETEAEMLISEAPSQKTPIDDARQQSRAVSKSLKLNESSVRGAATNDPSLLVYSTGAAGDDRSLSPSSGRLRTSPRGAEVSLCIH